MQLVSIGIIEQARLISVTVLGPSNVVTDGFFDLGSVRPGTKLLTLEEYCKQEVNQKRAVLLINAKPE